MINVATLLNQLKELATRLNLYNATDKDIKELSNIHGELAREFKSMDSRNDAMYYAGYIAGWNDHMAGQYGNMRCVETLKELKLELRAQELLGKKDTVDLVDPDTGQVLSNVPVTPAQTTISHTEFWKLVDRVAKLEHELFGNDGLY
jgi:hypothetical protein